METKVVSIEKVKPWNDKGRPWSTYKMKAVLEKQGQIEPLQVRPINGGYRAFFQDPWGDEIIYAARELKWDTLLVLITERWIE
jgi:hypothetical protein